MVTGALTDEVIGKLAAQAIVSEDTIKRRLLGLPVKGKAGERADAVLAEWRNAGNARPTA